MAGRHVEICSISWPVGKRKWGAASPDIHQAKKRQWKQQELARMRRKKCRCRTQCACGSKGQQDRSTSNAASFIAQKSWPLFQVMKKWQGTKLEPAEVWSNHSHRGKQERAFSGNSTMPTLLTPLPTIYSAAPEDTVPWYKCSTCVLSTLRALGPVWLQVEQVCECHKASDFITCNFNFDSHTLSAGSLLESEGNRCI